MKINYHHAKPETVNAKSLLEGDKINGPDTNCGRLRIPYHAVTGTGNGKPETRNWKRFLPRSLPVLPDALQDIIITNIPVF